MLESGGFISNVKNEYALTEKGFRLVKSTINRMSEREKNEELIKQIIQLKPEEILTIGNTFVKKNNNKYASKDEYSRTIGTVYNSRLSLK